MSFPGSSNSGTAKMQQIDEFKSSSVNMRMVERERCSWTMKKLCDGERRTVFFSSILLNAFAVCVCEREGGGDYSQNVITE